MSGTDSTTFGPMTRMEMRGHLADCDEPGVMDMTDDEVIDRIAEMQGVDEFVAACGWDASR